MDCVIDIDDFVSFMRFKQRLGEGTIVSRKSRIKCFINWLDKREITSQTIEVFFSYLRDKKINNASLNTYRAVLLTYEKYLIDRFSHPPFMKGFKHFPEDEVFIDPLSDAEIQRLIECEVSSRYESNKEYSDFITFIAYTGCRLNEAITLKSKYVDLTEGRVSFVNTKTKKIRHVYFITPVYEVLKNRNKEYVFSINGKPINQRAFAFHLERRRLKTGIKKRVFPHLLRHSWASASYNATGDIYLTKEMLGHQNINTTLRYTKIANKRMKENQINHPFNEKYLDPKKIIETVEKETREKLLKKFDPQVVSEAVYAMTQRLYDSLNNPRLPEYAPVTSP